MDLYELLDQIVDLLRQRGQVTYRLLKRQFELDDEALDDLKEELLYAHPVVDDNGRGLVWTGEADPSSESDVKRETDVEARFHAIIPVLIALLQLEGRITYPSLMQIFGLDDVLLGNLCKDLIFL